MRSSSPYFQNSHRVSTAQPYINLVIPKPIFASYWVICAASALPSHRLLFPFHHGSPPFKIPYNSNAVKIRAVLYFEMQVFLFFSSATVNGEVIENLLTFPVCPVVIPVRMGFPRIRFRHSIWHICGKMLLISFSVQQHISLSLQSTDLVKLHRLCIPCRYIQPFCRIERFFIFKSIV